MNDLQVLSKLLAVTIASCPDNAHAIERQADSAVAMLLQRLLAGRLYEGWKLLKVHGRLIRESYEPDFKDTEKTALQSLRSYFGSSKSHLARVRDKLGFHNDADLAEAAYDRLGERDDLGSYISITLGNTIHLTPELMHYEAICEITGEADYLAAMNILWGDTKYHVSNFNHVFNRINFKFLERYLPRALANLADNHDDIEAMEIDQLNFRFFSDLSTISGQS